MTMLQALHRHRIGLAIVLAASAVAWWWTVVRMGGMAAAPGTDLGTLGWFTGTWVLMMAAMMLPSFAPTIGVYLSPPSDRSPVQWLLFTGGYLLVWTVAGLAAYGVFELGKELLGGPLAWHRGGRWLSAAVLAAAAAYEFVPLKQVCLARCRGRLGRDVHGGIDGAGWEGALVLGVRSGGWCIGSSAALMAALFALGVMSITWMVVVAALVALEKLGPWPRLARFATAAVLAALAVGILVAPSDVPGFVVPSSGAMHAMSMMG